MGKIKIGRHQMNAAENCGQAKKTQTSVMAPDHLWDGLGM